MVNQTNDNAKQLQEKLLTEPNEEEVVMMQQQCLIQNLKSYSILIGMCCGIFVQLSTLGANFLLVALWGEEALLARSQHEAMLFSLSWSFFTSCMALLVLSMLRGLINSILDAHTNSEVMDRDAMMMTIEVRYVVGSLIGVCFAWTVTDLILGMQSLALYSLGTLVVALIWSKVMVWCFVSRNEEDEDDNNKMVIDVLV